MSHTLLPVTVFFINLAGIVTLITAVAYVAIFSIGAIFGALTALIKHFTNKN